jgi:hypothetical protein
MPEREGPPPPTSGEAQPGPEVPSSTADLKIVQALITLLEHPAGFEVGLFGILTVYRLESGLFALLQDGVSDFTVYETAAEAAAHLLHQRETRRLGFDFETEAAKREDGG